MRTKNTTKFYSPLPDLSAIGRDGTGDPHYPVGETWADEDLPSKRLSLPPPNSTSFLRSTALTKIEMGRIMRTPRPGSSLMPHGSNHLQGMGRGDGGGWNGDSQFCADVGNRACDSGATIHSRAVLPQASLRYGPMRENGRGTTMARRATRVRRRRRDAGGQRVDVRRAHTLHTRDTPPPTLYPDLVANPMSV